MPESQSTVSVSVSRVKMKLHLSLRGSEGNSCVGHEGAAEPLREEVSERRNRSFV